MATCFRIAGKPFPEPLITIYEPSAYMRFMEFLAMGYACPRKVLINTDVKIIDTPDADSFYNTNTPKDLAYIKQVIDVRKV
jgi:molybdopterin-guanine dinucleotide biosynthesis protein A